ncbi:hypothetical protein ACODM8_01580 [Vibrio ostreicida]|uniref:hypothetical protein n=1 Tax=Vibrio ostreicida TaxID=526588 RepID=UPI003B5B67E2
MSNRVKVCRYQDPELRDRLASEYVLGTLTVRVKRRLEHLIHEDPSWWQHIEQWHQHLSDLSPAKERGREKHTLAEPPKRIWKNIAARTWDSRNAHRTLRWWWLPTGMALSMVIGITIQPMIVPPIQSVSVMQVRPASYLAMMSSPTKNNHFALVAYQGDKPGQSSIRLQRNLGMENVSFDSAMVWMRDSLSGELTLIDSLENVKDVRFMSPKEWGALKNSSELLVTKNRDPSSQVLYRGRCVELSDWQAI